MTRRLAVSSISLTTPSDVHRLDKPTMTFNSGFDSAYLTTSLAVSKSIEIGFSSKTCYSLVLILLRKTH